MNARTNNERTIQQMIFVVGSGRSGTHLLGHLIAAHPKIATTIEEPEIFDLVTRLALSPPLRTRLIPELIAAYMRRLVAIAPLHYADKSHPNIWLAEELAHAFRHSRFVGIERDPYATVASMLKHEGVLYWHRNWHRYPVPNSFLGISQDIAPIYDNLSLPEQCALRWAAHTNRMHTLPSLLGRRFHLINYEELIDSAGAVIERLFSFLNLSPPSQIPDIRRDSRERWKKELTAEQVADIRAVLTQHLTTPNRELYLM